MNSKLIRFSGFWNIGLALLLIYPSSTGIGFKSHSTRMGVGWVIAGFLLYTAATLIISAHDLARYGSIIVYEALLRFIAAALLIPAGLYFGYGWIAALLGITDALWGAIYLVVVPSRTGKSISRLLMGQQN